MNRKEKQMKDFSLLRTKGLNIQEAAKIVGVSRQTGGEWEKPRKKLLKRISETESYYDKRIAAGAGTDELVKLGDLISKLHALKLKVMI